MSMRPVIGDVRLIARHAVAVVLACVEPLAGAIGPAMVAASTIQTARASRELGEDAELGGREQREQTCDDSDDEPAASGAHTAPPIVGQLWSTSESKASWVGTGIPPALRLFSWQPLWPRANFKQPGPGSAETGATSGDERILWFPSLVGF